MANNEAEKIKLSKLATNVTRILLRDSTLENLIKKILIVSIACEKRRKETFFAASTVSILDIQWALPF